MGRIVVGVDGSEHSRRALRWALEEADLRGASLEAVAAWSYPYLAGADAVATVAVDPRELQATTARALEEALEECATPAQRDAVKRTVVEDRPARALLDAANGADLLVVGSRGRGGFAGLLLGSVSSQCVHHASCPVVVVPASVADD
jgi:nucleotide-binding universal stress UspA family protein